MTNLSSQELLIKLREEKKPAVDKLVNDLKKYNIKYSPTDGELDNVIFETDTRIHKIAHQMFFRLCSKSHYWTVEHKGREEHLIAHVMNDEKYYDWLKMIILFGLKIEKV